jgi:hypothetical protein
MTDEVAVDVGASLEDRLREFAAFYDSNTGDVDKQRHASCQALMEIASHLQREGIPGDILRPVTAVIHGLFDVDKGNASPIFKPSKRAGGRNLPFAVQSQRGLDSAAVTLRMQAGESEKRALRKVAGQIGRSRAARQRRAWKKNQRPLWEALRDWREKAMSGGREDQDASSYLRMLETAKGGNPSHWADWALTEGQKLYR